MLQLGSVAPSSQIAFHYNKNSNSELFEHIIQPKSQFSDPIFSGEFQHGISLETTCKCHDYICVISDFRPANVMPYL